MHFVTIPSPQVVILDPLQSDKPLDAKSATELLRSLFTDKRFVDVLGVFDAYDLRKKLLDSLVDVTPTAVGVNDAEREVLKTVATNPQSLNPVILTSPDVVEFLRALANPVPVK